MELVEQTVKMPKEAKDVKDFIVELIKDLKAKKDVAAIAGENLAGLMKAIEGFEQLPEEAKSPQIAMLAGVLAGEIGEVLMTKAEA